jgi:hypothetical protein
VDLNTLIITVFCLVDDWLHEQQPPRRRGPAPKLSDSEVLTIEIVGEFLGIDAEKDLYAYFRRHYGEWFPVLKRVHRTTFTRQMANLWANLGMFFGSFPHWWLPLRLFLALLRNGASGSTPTRHHKQETPHRDYLPEKTVALGRYGVKKAQF